MIKKCLFLFVILNLISCTSQQKPLEQWHNFSDQWSINTQGLDPSKSLFVVYRLPEPQQKAIDIYINSDYQASLLNNGLTILELCADKNFISTSYVTNTRFGNRTEGVSFYLPSQAVTYVKVFGNDPHTPHFMFVDEQTAKQEIAQLQLQTDTLSRVVNKNCTNQSYVLATENISFAFDSYQANKLSHQDKNKLISLINIVNQDPNKITKVVLDGYSDPVGKANYNQKLSDKRAKSVATFLTNNGLSLPLEVKGFGASNLLRKDCEKVYSKDPAQIKQCNLINRRVTVSVFGTK